MCRALGIAARIGGVEAVDVGQQHQHVGADHLRDARRQPVVVAEADFGRGDRVVLVDHRHGAQRQQLREGGAGVEVAAALLGVVRGQQDLRHGDAVARQRFLVGVRQADLAGRGRGLLLLQPQGAAAQPEMRGGRPRSRPEETTMTSWPRRRQRAMSSASASSQSRRISPSSADQQRRADLQHDPPRRRQRRRRGDRELLPRRWREPAMPPPPALPRLRGRGRVAVRRDPLARWRGRDRVGVARPAMSQTASSSASTMASARASRIVSTSAPSSGCRPAPLTPDSGNTGVPGPAARASARRFSSTSSGSIASILLRPIDLGLVGEAVAVGGELAADRALGADHILLGAVDQVQEHGAALDMAEEAVAEPGAFAAPSISPGMSASTNSSRRRAARRRAADAGS